MLCGIATLVKYRTSRDCLFKICRSDEKFFETNYFADVWIKVLFAVNVGFLIIFKYIYLNDIKKFDLRRNNERITPGSYTALVGNVDGLEEGTKLGQFIEKMVPGVTVSKINFIYNISEFYVIIRHWMKVEKKITLLETKGLNHTPFYTYLVLRRKKLKEEYYSLKNDIKVIENFNGRFTGFAFVTFNMQKHLNAVLQKLNYRILNFQFHKTKYTIYPAKEPEDIIWQNFGLSFKQKIIRRCISGVISTLIILISFAIVFGVKYAQHRVNETNKSKAFFYMVAFGIAEIILVINFLLRSVLRKLTFWESRTTITSYNSVLALKISVVYFCNIALVILVANIIVLKSELWGSNGVVGNIFIFQAIAVVSNSVFEMINPIYFWKKFLKWYYVQKIIKSARSNKVLQCEFNNACEGVDFDIAERYYLTFKTISVVFFFQTVMPYLLLFGIAELIIIYWTQKYVLFKRANRPKDLDFNFSLKMTRIFDFMICILTFGYFIFEMIIIHKTSVFAIIMCAVSATAAIAAEGISRLPYFDKKHDGTEQPFTEACKTFANDFDRLNPVTQKEAVIEWLEKIGSTPGSYRSFQHINDHNEPDINSKIFNTISRYVVQNKQYGPIPIKLRNSQIEEPLEELHYNPNDTFIELQDLNYYKIASDALERQRSMYFSNKFLEHKNTKDTKSGKINKENLIQMSSQVVMTEYIPHTHVHLNPFVLETNKKMKRFQSSLKKIQEEKNEVNRLQYMNTLNDKKYSDIDEEIRDSVKVMKDIENNMSDMSVNDTSQEFEVKVKENFDTLAKYNSNDDRMTFNDEQ